MMLTRTLPSGLKCEIDDSADVVRNPLAGVGIAVDGVYASGKGTLAVTLARLYRLKFLDTGTLYRSVGYRILQAGGDAHDAAAAIEASKGLEYDFRHKGNNVFGTWLDGVEVSDALRTPEVSVASAVVGTVPEVRVELSRIMEEYGQKWQPLVGVIMDGRDIGWRIMPKAQVKLYLDGDVGIRAKRRWVEYQARGKDITLQEVEDELRARDGRDAPNTSRSLAEKDVVVIDTTHMDAAEVLKAAEEVIGAKCGAVSRAAVGN